MRVGSTAQGTILTESIARALDQIGKRGNRSEKAFQTEKKIWRTNLVPNVAMSIEQQHTY